MLKNKDSKKGRNTELKKWENTFRLLPYCLVAIG